MFNILVVDNDHETLETELKGLKKNWTVLGVPDAKTALALINETQTRFDAIIAHLGPPHGRRQQRKGLDAIMMLLVLKGWQVSQNTHIFIMLNTPHDERDNTAAIAAGARLVWHRPRFEEEQVSFLKAMFRSIAFERLNNWQRFAT